MNKITLTWYECDCEYISKYCEQYHRSTARVTREDLYDFLEGLT